MITTCIYQTTLTGEKIQLFHKWKYIPINDNGHEIFREVCVNCGMYNFIKR